jgi:hypothetical protein
MMGNKSEHKTSRAGNDEDDATSNNSIALGRHKIASERKWFICVSNHSGRHKWFSFVDGTVYYGDSLRT